MPINKAEQHQPSQRRRLHRLVAAVAIASGAVVVLASCGSSGKSSSSSAGKSVSTTQRGSRANAFASLRACLQKEGINLPSAPSGGGPADGGPPGPGGGFKLPQGVSQSKFQEAMKKCGGGGFPGGARRGFNSSTARAALTKYASCMRENGVNLPTPNTNGNGPVFNAKGIDTSSTAFKNARQKCQGDLKGAFSAGRPPGGEGGPPGGPPNGEAPPAGEGSPNS